ncbi:MAG: S8 family serine peptidase [Xanthomonadales bacterium]|nr:S8 family serine peptidase [Gammaproteobacteria bacterium]NNK03626.1 S8 family serine peptidase [Xanthomonadales bacterium]
MKVIRFVLAVALLTTLGAIQALEPAPMERFFIEFKPGTGAIIEAGVRADGGQVHHHFKRADALAVSVTSRLAKRLGSDPNIVTMEPDARRYLAAKQALLTSQPLLQSDPFAEQLVPYGVELVQAPLVWDQGFEGEGITVCIIDTGLYEQHEDIDSSFVLGGHSQDPNSQWFEDGDGHGTHVAGTVSAADNDIGVIGVSPGKASLFVVKIFGEDGLWTYASDLVAAAFTCADHGADIISMSLSGSSGPGPERKAFESLYNEEGILSVAAASNGGNRQRVFPASYDSVISVAAVDESKLVADFSNQNKWVELAAPGVGVWSTVPHVSNSWLFTGGNAYQGEPMEYAPDGVVTGQLADGGMCIAAETPGDWSGMAVLCERGEVTFAEKVATVMAGNGSAAVIYNNEPGALLGTLGEEGGWIVAIGIGQQDGQAALDFLGQEATVQSSAPVPGSSYEPWGGTSMATPHVAGVAALLWSANPAWTNVQIREAMDMTAMDLGEPGRDIAYGYGLVQADAALQYLLAKSTE